ncbi:unnamed protein product, partial [Didymodactylos carnosus]
MSTQSSILFDNTSLSDQQQQQYYSSSSNLHYDLSLIAPLTLSRRNTVRKFGDAGIIHLPKLKPKSTMSLLSHEFGSDDIMTRSITSSEQEIALFKKNFDRQRASLSQCLEDNRYKIDRAHYRIGNFQQLNEARDDLLHQLSKENVSVINKIETLKQEIIDERHQRDSYEMEQLVLQRKLNHLKRQNIREEAPLEDMAKKQLLNDEHQEYLLRLTKEQTRQCHKRDEEIEQLKEKLCELFNYKADEWTKLLYATQTALNYENQKKEILKQKLDYIEKYELK